MYTQLCIESMVGQRTEVSLVTTNMGRVSYRIFGLWGGGGGGGGGMVCNRQSSEIASGHIHFQSC